MIPLILDRDGVINQDSDAYVKNSQEWIPIEGSLSAIAQLQSAGFLVVVATNQSGIGRGLYPLEQLHAMHDKMNRLLQEAGGSPLDVAFCPHTPDDHCDCRKPKPGLLYQLADAHGFDLKHAMVVGDSLRDLQAADAVGAKSYLVRTGKGARTLAQHPKLPYPVFDSLAHVAEHLIHL